MIFKQTKNLFISATKLIFTVEHLALDWQCESCRINQSSIPIVGLQQHAIPPIIKRIYGKRHHDCGALVIIMAIFFCQLGIKLFILEYLTSVLAYILTGNTVFALIKEHLAMLLSMYLTMREFCSGTACAVHPVYGRDVGSGHWYF